LQGAARGATLGQLADGRSDVGLGLQLADELPDLAVGYPGSPPEQRLRVLAGQVRSQPGDPAQVQPAVAQHVQQGRALAGGPGHGDAQVGFVRAEGEHTPPVLEHRRADFVGVQPAPLDLADVGDDVGLAPPRLPHELGQLMEKVLVSEALSAW
jgi:hypothetical protein